MRPTASDWIMFVYNLAVVLSGGYIVMQGGINDRWSLIGIAFIFAIFWTVYFRYTIHSRLVDQATPDEDEDEESDDLSPVP